MRKVFMGRLVLAGLLLMLPSTLSAQTFDAELKALASKLIVQMEDAKLKSGTVLDFTDLQGTPNELGRFLAQELSNQLVAASKKMSFVDRANLQMLLRENKLSVEGLINPESSKKLGNLIGIDTMIFGTTTPLGRNIRLSVRAVAVETGRIVASQATTLTSTDAIAELSNHGVTGSSSSQGAAEPSNSNDLRHRLRGDSIRVAGKEIIAASNSYTHEVNATAFVVVENLSGKGFEAALVPNSATIGGCPVTTVAGLGVFVPPGGWGTTQWQYVSMGGKLNVTLSAQFCRTDLTLAQGGTSNIAASMAIKTDKGYFSVPLSASQIPIKISRRQ